MSKPLLKMNQSAFLKTSFLKSFHEVGHNLVELVMNKVYPNVCAACELNLMDTHEILCHRCMRQLEKASVHDVTFHLAQLPFEAQRLYQGFALWVFDKGGLIQKMQHQLKYQNRPLLGKKIGLLMGNTLRDAMMSFSPDAIIPVPLADKRYLERGYNQSEWLAQGLSDALQLPLWTEVLKRQQNTRSQVHLNNEARWQNVSAAFGCNEDLSGKRFLLVDDVLTTGATLAAAAKPLLDAGAAEVRCATFAVVR